MLILFNVSDTSIIYSLFLQLFVKLGLICEIKVINFKYAFLFTTDLIIYKLFTTKC